MTTINEIESAFAALPPGDTVVLYQRLARHVAPAPGANRPHSILDIPPLDLGEVLPLPEESDAVLGEMLEGRK